MESDSLIGIEEILKQAFDCLWLTVINDIQEVTNSFISCSFSFVRRKCNSLAHEVAHWDLGGSAFKVWFKELPHGVRNTNIL